MPGRPFSAESESDNSDVESLNLQSDLRDEDDQEKLKGKTTKSKGPEFNQLLQDLESEDDDAPDDISFSASKKSILDRLHEARKQIEREKAVEKAKQQRREKLYQNQKKEKLEKAKRKRKNTVDDVPQGSDDDDDDDAGAVEDDANKPSHINFSDSDLSDTEADEMNFIPLSSTGGIKPVYTQDVARLAPDRMTAMEFKQRQMFGGRIKRQSMKELRKVVEKKQARRHRPQKSISSAR